MGNWKRLRQWISVKLGSDSIDAELEDHFESLRQERLDAGASSEEASRFARHRLGHATAIREEVRSLSPRHRVESIVQHTRFSLRAFVRYGGTYGAAASILSLGIGLSVTLFSLVDAVLLAPLPFPNQDRVHLVWKSDPANQGHLVGELAYPELADLQSTIADAEFVALFPAAPYGNGRMLQVASREPVQIESCPASTDFFKALGVLPSTGRGFTAADAARGAAPVVILSDAVWRQHFDARQDVLNQQVRINGRGHLVIGVMPPGFDFPRGTGLWINMAPGNRREVVWFQAVIRSRADAPLDKLRQAADRTFQLQLVDNPKQYSNTQRAVVTPIADYLAGTSKPQLLLALAASILLLLSACVCAGNLFLSRALGRRQEVATRTALGATWSQLVQQFVIESVVVGTIATATGAAVAALLIRLLIRWAPADIPRIENAGLNTPALAVAVLMALIASAACTIGPLILLRRGDGDGLLRGTGSRTTVSRSGTRLQHGFLFLQTASTVMILVASGLLFASYRALLGTDPGLANRDALTVNLVLRGPQINPDNYRRTYLELIARLRANAAVSHAAGVLLRPLEGPIGWDTVITYEFENGRTDPHRVLKANFEVVTPGYFDAVGTPLLMGRDFSGHDSKEAEKVLVISESLSRRFRDAGLDPIGQRMGVFGEPRKVVGVVADARYRGIRQPGQDVYVPHWQIDMPTTNYLIVRGGAPPAELLSLVRRTLKELDANQAIGRETTLGELIDRNTARDRFNLMLLLLFAAGAIVLAVAGIHSVTRESVTARAKEIAVRIALGAQRGEVTARTASRLLLYVAGGTFLGVIVAIGLASTAEDLLYGISPKEPAILLSVVGFVLVIAVISSFFPAWNAAGKDPREQLLSD